MTAARRHIRVFAAFVVTVLLLGAYTAANAAPQPVPNVSYLAASPDGRLLASATSRGWLSIWDLYRGRPTHVFKAHDDDIHVLRFSPGGKFLLSGANDQTAKLWSASDFRNIRTFRFDGQVTGGAVFAGGARVVLGLWDGGLGIWNVASGQQEHSAKGHFFGRVTIDISPSGNLVATGGSDQTIRIWDAATMRQMRLLVSGEQGNKAHLGIIYHLRFLAHDRLLSMASRGGAELKYFGLWNVETGQRLQAEEGAGRWAGLTLSKDRHRALFARRSGDDQQAVVFDPEDWRAISILKPDDGIKATALAANGRVAMTGSGNGLISFWDADTGVILAQAWNRFDRGWGVKTPDGRSDNGEPGGLRLLADILRLYMDGAS